MNARRQSVAAAFFMSEEFQASGSYIYDLYAGALGRRPGFAEYSADRAQVVGGATLDAAKNVFAQNFVQRSEFTAKYQNASAAESFVDALLQSVQSSGGNLSWRTLEPDRCLQSRRRSFEQSRGSASFAGRQRDVQTVAVQPGVCADRVLCLLAARHRSGRLQLLGRLC